MRSILYVFIAYLFLFSSISHAAQTRVIAVVNGDMISSYDLEQRSLPILQSMGISLTDKKKEEQIRQIQMDLLNQMIEQKVLVQEAAKEGIAVSDEVIDRELQARMQSMNLSEAEFFKEAAKNGLTESVMREDIRNNLLLQQLVSKNIMQKILIDEEQIEEYFKAHPEIKGTDFKYRIGLLIYPNKSTAEKYAKDINDGKISFKEAARKVSVGPNPYNSGDMGMASVEDLAPSLVQIIQPMELGQVSPLINLGPSLAQVILIDSTYTPGDSILDEQTKEQIKIELRRPKFEEEYAEYTDKLMERAIIDNKF